MGILQDIISRIYHLKNLYIQIVFSTPGSMATNSVRRLFVDAQHRVAAASSSVSSSASSSGCSCNSWSAASSSGSGLNNPPITMMAKFVKEDNKPSGQSGWNNWNNQKSS